MATRAKATLVGFLCIIGTVAVAPTAGAAPEAGQSLRQPAITFTEIGPRGSTLADLSERGHVVYSVNHLGYGADGAYRWYQGEAVRLTPPFTDTVFVSATAVNARGDVVGAAHDLWSIEWRGFVWRDGVITPLPPRSDFSKAEDINDWGAVLVNRDENDATYGYYRAGVLFGDREIDSPVPPGHLPLAGEEINNWGTVIGNAQTEADASTSTGFVWHPWGQPVELAPGTDASTALEINDRGSVLGQSSTGGGGQTFLWRFGRLTELALYLPSPDPSRTADLLNNRDQVAGQIPFGQASSHAALWSRGRTIDLGTLGGTYSVAYGVNDRGDVVGVSERADGTFGAFLWRNGTMTDLGALVGPETSYAVAINNRGQVLGGFGDNFSGANAQIVLWETRPQR